MVNHILTQEAVSEALNQALENGYDFTYEKPMLKPEKSEFRVAFDRLRWVRYKLANRRKALAKLRKSIDDLKEAEKSLLLAIREIKQSHSRKNRSHEV